MRISVIAIISLFLLSQMTYADDTAGKLGLGGHIGAMSYAGDIADKRFALSYDVNLDIWYTTYFGMNFTYGKGFLSASETTDESEKYFKTYIWNYTLLMKIKLMPSSRINPYIGAGFSLIDIDPKKRDGDRALNRAQEKYEKINPAYPLVMGFSYFFTENFALNLDGIYHYSGTDYLDDLKKGKMNDSWSAVSMGLTLYFGSPRDSDNDGIPDKKDRDPLYAEDFDGFQDYDGIPDLDNDRDGIPDKLDSSPNDPEDKDGYMDSDGRPDPDNDLDGVPDNKDACPGTDEDLDTKEDMDGFQDSDGCPDPDNDDDGILDGEDECPDQAETMNGYEDLDGCPDTKPEIAVEKGQALILEGVTFASGSTRLTPESQVVLDKVVRTLRNNPGIEVEIRGYTDNTGRYESNLQISKGRADSVRDYLIQNGIDGNRIVTRGFGPADPIAPNTTREGRAKNRRIEFLRVK